MPHPTRTSPGRNLKTSDATKQLNPEKEIENVCEKIQTLNLRAERQKNQASEDKSRRHRTKK